MPQKYNFISGIFPKYLQKIKKINNTFQHKFLILHDSVVNSLLRKDTYCFNLYLPTYPLRVRWHIRLIQGRSIDSCQQLFFLHFSRFFPFSLDLPLLSFSMSLQVFLGFFFPLLVSKRCFCIRVVSFSKNMTQLSKLSLIYYCDQVFLSCSYIKVFICFFPGLGQQI